MPRKIPLPRDWNRQTKAAIVQILALSHYCFSAVLGAAHSYNRRNPTSGRASVGITGASSSFGIFHISLCPDPVRPSNLRST